MSGELVPRPFEVPVPRRTSKVLRAMTNETRMEQAAIRAISRIGECGMFAVLEIKNTQAQLELTQPAASEAISVIASTVTMAIASSIQRFANEIG